MVGVERVKLDQFDRSVTLVPTSTSPTSISIAGWLDPDGGDGWQPGDQRRDLDVR